MKVQFLWALAALVAAAGAAGAGCRASYPPLARVSPAPDAVCLVGGRVLTGPALVPVDDATVCFAGGRLTVVQAGAPQTWPAGAARIDVGGHTVMPGLVDTHVHVTATDAPPWAFTAPDAAHNLEAWLHTGITTVYDMGGDPAELAELAAKTEAGTLPGPRIFFGHEPITAPGGHPIPAIKALLPWPLGALLAGQVPTLERAADAAALVRTMKERGAGHIKIIHDALPPGAPRLDVDRLKALSRAAHDEGLAVFVHIGSNQDGLEALAAGADHLAHGVYNAPISDELIAALVERKVGVTYTAAGFDNTRDMTQGRYAPDPAIAPTTDPAILAAVSGQAGAAFDEQEVLADFARTIADAKTLRDNVRRLHEAGVMVLPGTDSPIAAVFPGGSYLEELDLMHDAGMPADVLVHRATVDAAALKWREGMPRFGELSEGARADVLVVEGDPLTDLSALRRRHMVFAQGRRVDTP